MPHIRKNDQVIVITGKSKGKTGRVIQVLPKKERVFVEKVNMVKRHVKPGQKNPQGGIVEKEASIHISNVMLLDAKTGKGARVKQEFAKDGSKKRISKKTQQVFEAKL